jgi:hypothetical protein
MAIPHPGLPAFVLAPAAKYPRPVIRRRDANAFERRMTGRPLVGGEDRDE